MTTSTIFPVIWQNDHAELIDQTRLPQQYKTVAINNYQEMARAIKTMIVRGAPAIGVAAAYGIYLGARAINTQDKDLFLQDLEKVGEVLGATRPTAVNLFWAISRMLKVARETPGTVEDIKNNLLVTAQAVQQEDLGTCQAIGNHGLSILPASPEKVTVLTHCNAGSLATAGYGTALGVIRSIHHANRLASVYADETRPRLQGAKLTAWECVQEKIPVTVIADNMAAHCMQQKRIDLVVVGADRIAANGDAANKIGTYSLALVAKAHNVPFYVAAPLSTIDFSLASGEQIPIEERDISEIYQLGTSDIQVEGASFYNPAFDVTPAELIAGIITEKGVSPANKLQDL